MALTIPHYAKIKDNYCIAYFGYNNEYLIQLKLLRPIIEKELPGIKVYLACKKDSMYLLQNEERILDRETLIDTKYNQFAYVREINCDMLLHPIEELLQESDLPCGPIHIETKITNGRKCVLLTNGILPTKSLTSEKIKSAIHFIQTKGFNVILNEDISDADWVVGVENEKLYQSAALGKKTTLIPTGLGTNIFKNMFPNSEILSL